MKRIVSCILIAVLCFATTACSGGDVETPVETSPAEESIVETVPVETELPVVPVLTFVEENSIVTNSKYSELFYEEVFSDSHIFGVYLYSDLSSTVIECLDKNFLYRNLDSQQGQYYDKDITVVKYYGEGESVSEYDTMAQISVYETPLNLVNQYDEIASFILRMNEEDPASYIKNADAIAEESLQLYNKYPNYKLVSCELSFEWGTVEQMDLFEEAGSIFVEMGFEVFDKYSGKVFPTFKDTLFVEDMIEFNGKTYDVAVLTSDTVSYSDDLLFANVLISAIVPMEYDGLVFAVGDGDIKNISNDEMVLCNYTESHLFSDPDTGYYAYQPVMIENEGLSALADVLYERIVVAAPHIMPAPAFDFAEIEGLRCRYNESCDVAVSTEGTVYVENNPENHHSISVFVTDSNYEFLYQSGAIAPGEALSDISVLDSLSENWHYGIVYYDEAGAAILIEFLEMR